MFRKKYSKSYNPIMEYWQKIEHGEIPVCRKTYQWYKYLSDKILHPDSDMTYNPARANHVLEFAETFCCPSKGDGSPVVLELWEKAHLAAVFGFVDINGNRTCRESLFIVGKKKWQIALIINRWLIYADRRRRTGTRSIQCGYKKRSGEDHLAGKCPHGQKIKGDCPACEMQSRGYI